MNFVESFINPEDSNRFRLKVSFDVNKKSHELEFAKYNVYLSACGLLYYETTVENFVNVRADQCEKRLWNKLASDFGDLDFEDAFNRMVTKYAKSYDNMRFSVVTKFDNDDHMHSFYLNDLNWGQSLPDNKNLSKYINGTSQNEPFVDFNDEEKVKEYTQPKYYPLGRFPSNPEYSLSLMQQVAVNVTTNVLDNEAIQGVNGPPGTGKTTLLKEIFADYIVKQAKLIVDSPETAVKGGEEVRVSYKKRGTLEFLDKKISDLEILVASSNNDAVRNIVAELPDAGAIHGEFLSAVRDIGYFNEGEDDNGNSEPRWGEFSREGGKRANLNVLDSTISTIVEKLKSENSLDQTNIYRQFKELYNDLSGQRDALQKNFDKKAKLITEKKDKQKRLAELEDSVTLKKTKQADLTLELHSMERDLSEHATNHSFLTKFASSISFLSFLLPEATKQRKEKVENIKSQLATIENEMKDSVRKVETLRSSLDSIEKDLAVIISLSGDINGYDNQLFNRDLNRDEIQMGNPFFNREYRVKQTELFILALAVRKQFLIKQYKNLENARLVFKQKNRFSEHSEVLAEAWHWINFAIPVISTTFASFGKMFDHFSENSLGNLFIDEAGQAVPAAAVGSIARAKKVLAVGDPQQITPVQTMDQKLFDYLAKLNQVSQNYVQADLSVQNLIDDGSSFGFTIDVERIGIPLTVHRRCSSPMFEISNKLSYNDRMVQGKVGSKGTAKWLDISGRASDKVVKEQNLAAVQLVKKLTQNNEVAAKDIYIISPFKSIVAALRRNKELTTIIPTNSIGTVHTFQGKENKIVIFVLGADYDSKSSASWAFKTANIANVAVTRSKEKLYVIGDRSLYSGIKNSKIMMDIIEQYNKR
ncbi:hypothetical protein G6R29_00925 [Fructobacillus sp. M2-14]|uniref:DNA helicase n=1 Tax=Fructobacillus broussonetiae TaxID=2713173 RepID=A0ABS5QYB1_9LACO|nr:AAA domain-containing protein [Fructobacillus broussonetiae]MBS9338196.1 hypothetical protein [Fructobacillus broussonetiae]